MDVKVKSGSLENISTPCIVIPVFVSHKLTATGEQLDTHSKGYLSSLLKHGDLEGPVGQTLWLYDPPHLKAQRILLINAGKEHELSESVYRKVVASAAIALQHSGTVQAISCLTDLPIKGRDLAWKAKTASLITHQQLYRFDQYKSKPNTPQKPLRELTLHILNDDDTTQTEQSVALANAIGTGMKVTRDLANTPANDLTPIEMAERAKKIAKTHHLKITILDEKDLEKHGMGAMIAVAKGSQNPPRIIILEHQGGKKSDKPAVLVGKGITFDTGGLSLKPAASMVGMKYDMSGSATVLGTMHAVSELKLPINVIGVMVCAENMIGPNATRPDDIITTMAKKTVEITNTDAEGRLVLCDALSYIEKYNPDVVIDIATLTGAVVIALGSQASGLFANHEPLQNDLVAAGNAIGDRVWPMPIWSEYHELLDSPVADCVNSSSAREAQSITAACFLAKFTEKYQWAHLDIAGTARVSHKDPAPSGRPVPLLVEYLMSRAHG